MPPSDQTPDREPADPGPGEELQPGEPAPGYAVADVRPLDVDGVRTIQVGTLLWLAALLVLLPFAGRLQDQGRLWWLGTCAAGFGLGLLGWLHCLRRARKRRERRRA